MKHALGLAIAALLLAAPATADVADDLQEAIELAREGEGNAVRMMGTLPRACKALRRAAGAAEEAEDAAAMESIAVALEHCKRAVQALRNGDTNRASRRVEHMIAAIEGGGE